MKQEYYQLKICYCQFTWPEHVHVFQLTRGADFLRHQNPGVKQNHGDLLVPCSPGKLKAEFLIKMILNVT